MTAVAPGAYYDARVEGVEASSPAVQKIRKFHNDVKRAMLRRFATRAPRLIDLGCGRGGDVHKWRACEVEHVTAIDSSAASIQEARRRAAGDRKKHEFVAHDLTHGLPATCRKGTYDVATCFFAAQYFFGTETAAWTLVRCAADALRPGGTLVGIVPDATRVVDRFRAADGVVNDGVVSMRAMWAGDPAPFGSEYACGIAGTIVDGANVEYLTYRHVLKAIAEAVGFRAVDLGRIPGIDDDGYLSPPYTRDEAAAACTRMYRAFAFVKPA